MDAKLKIDIDNIPGLDISPVSVSTIRTALPVGFVEYKCILLCHENRLATTEQEQNTTGKKMVQCAFILWNHLLQLVMITYRDQSVYQSLHLKGIRYIRSLYQPYHQYSHKTL